MTAVAIVLAAGSGRRFGEKKQFLDLAGHPVFVHSLSLFQRASCVDEIICVVPKEDRVFTEEIISKYPLSKVKKVVAGGAARQDSVAEALFDLEKDKFSDDLVLVHDGARPFLSLDLVATLVRQARVCGAVVAARRVTDSLKEVSAEGLIQRSIPRENLWAMQTPQVFRLSLLVEAYRKALSDGVIATDDAMIVERLGHPILCVEGPAQNIKITERADLKIAESWVREGIVVKVVS